MRPYAPHLLVRWALWRDHFVQGGSSLERAGEEAEACVEGVYLGTGVYDRSPALESPPSRGTGFVAKCAPRVPLGGRPPPALPSLAKPPAWRWADAVPMPPGIPSDEVLEARRRATEEAEQARRRRGRGPAPAPAAPPGRVA